MSSAVVAHAEIFVTNQDYADDAVAVRCVRHTCGVPQAETPTLRRGRRASSEGPGHRRDIQGLRALAVSLVLLYHLWPNRLTGGYVGVDVFFVISGFLITSHLLIARPDKPRDLATFWMRRIRRLLPAALLVLLATLLASRLFAPDSQ